MDASSSPKRRRLPFSLRTLGLLTVLLCLYLATWRPTKSLGVADVSARLTEENDGVHVQAIAKAPLWLALEIHSLQVRPGGQKLLVVESRYYFWLFGFVAKWPFNIEWARELDPNDL